MVPRRIPFNCRQGRHELIPDHLTYVDFYRCKYCFEIPDPVQLALRNFELRAWEEAKEKIPVLVDRIREVERRVKAEIETKMSRIAADSA
jgi:hypothetical protein